MIHAYYDDSGDPNAQDYAAFGGILGEAFNMSVFETQWATATRHLKEPFRSTECECQMGQFKDWSVSECNALMSQLVSLLSQKPHLSGVLGVVIPISLYHDVFPGSDRNAPARLAALLTIVQTVKLARYYRHPVKLCFEKGPTDSHVRTAYKMVQSHVFRNPWENNLLLGLDFKDKTHAPLQAADLVARESFKDAANRGKRRTRIPLLRMWDNAGVITWLEESLKALRNAGGPFDMAALDSLDSTRWMERMIDDPFHQGSVEI